MPEPSEPPTPADIAAYIEDMLSELADLASTHGFRPLSTSLRMIALDAARLADPAPSRD
ncbi:MAG TPA: hypothetical protein VEA79_13370 [Phenylobacterium sp.]|nr:hypothetical protein [Phenylobacterium sp.]